MEELAGATDGAPRAVLEASPAMEIALHSGKISGMNMRICEDKGPLTLDGGDEHGVAGWLRKDLLLVACC
jgi:hypothetical protein